MTLLLLAFVLAPPGWDYGGFARQPPASEQLAPGKLLRPTLIVPLPAPTPSPRSDTPAPPARKPATPPPAKPRVRTWEGEDCNGRTWKASDRDLLVRFLAERNRQLRARVLPPVEVQSGLVPLSRSIPFPPVRQPVPPSYSQPMSFSQPSYSQPMSFSQPSAGAFCAPGGT